MDTILSYWCGGVYTELPIRGLIVSHLSPPRLSISPPSQGGTPAIYHSGLDRAQAAALLSQHNMSTRLLIAPATEISAMP